MKKSNYKIDSLLLSSILMLHLIFLYFIKYSNQHLSLSEFSIWKIGNLFNLLIIICAVIGVVFYLRKGNSPGILHIFIEIITFVLIIAFVSTFIIFPSDKVYFFGQPGNKIFDAVLFTLYQFSMFLFISYAWLKIFGSDRLIFLRSIISSIFLLFFFLFLTYIFIQASGNTSDNWKISKDKNNVVVVLGAAVWSDNQPSPSLMGRIDRAIELFNNEFAGEIIFTGGSAPGEMSEAEVAMEYARKNGMQMSKVKFEAVTSSTFEQISYIKSNLIGKKNINQIIVVSDSYHLPRVLEISDFFNVNIKVAASKKKLSESGSVFRQVRESIALIVFWSFAL